jgi:Second Messenger Oligonucleotide or Dinucleotide Synthetase domain
MAQSVTQGFDNFLTRLVPLQSQREAATSHRASVETSLKNALDVLLFRETGSFNHGTGVRGHCDVDLLVSLKGQPGTSATSLDHVKTALSSSFPNTTVRISRPAVVVEFNDGAETWEIIPGYRKSGSSSPVLYEIPGVGSVNWMESAPIEHLSYVNDVNKEPSISGGAKKLARLAKAWKYYNSVPMSSFYLEMRSAQYLSGDNLFSPAQDICRFMEWLVKIGIGPMNDPKGVTSRFYACSSTAKGNEAKSKVATAASRARKAYDAKKADKPSDAFDYYNLLFGGKFPAR